MSGELVKLSREPAAGQELAIRSQEITEWGHGESDHIEIQIDHAILFSPLGSLVDRGSQLIALAREAERRGYQVYADYSPCTHTSRLVFTKRDTIDNYKSGFAAETVGALFR